MNKYLRSIVISFLILGSYHAHGQKWKFWSEIQNFKRQDSIQPPPINSILFVGSSSFRMWYDLQKSFPAHTIINRGFGGSELVDLIFYADDIIFAYHPKQIVIYAGENDIAVAGSAEIMFDRFRYLFKMIRAKLPDVNIVFVSMKPSLSRKEFIPEILKANAMVQGYLLKQSNASFVNVYKHMLTPQERPMPDIFMSDSLHLNAKGYAIWQRELTPYLLK